MQYLYAVDRDNRRVSSRFDPHSGHAGLSDARTNSSKSFEQAEQLYS